MCRKSEVYQAEQLDKLGMEVVPVELRDAYAFGGGLHCCTADVYREGELRLFSKTIIVTKIKTKRERVQFASDNVTGACPEVLNALLKANDEDKTPYGNDELSKIYKTNFQKYLKKKL